MNKTLFSEFALKFYQTLRRLPLVVWIAVVLTLAVAAYVHFSAVADKAQLREAVSMEAVSGGTRVAEGAMRSTPSLWTGHEFSISEYTTMLMRGNLSIIGLPDASSFRTANPHIFVVTRSGELGYVADTWRGSLTDQTMKDRPADVHVVTIGSTPGDESWSAAEVGKVGFQLLLIGVLLLFLKDMLPGGSSYTPVRDVETRFDDVIGAHEAKAALQDIVAYLKSPDDYAKIGARPSCGVLLYGAPGTGKTLLAKALAGECGVSFINCSGSDFTSKFLGVGVAKVKSLFARARKEGACIVFVDEIDGIGRRSSADGGPATAEANRIINQFLVELDGFEPHSRVILIGATNLVENVDPALLREGRFDRKIGVALPDVGEREALLGFYSKPLTLGNDIDFGQLARLTLGLSPAAIASMCNQAALRAVRAHSATVGMAQMREALETVHLGEESGTPLKPADRERTAIHEAGHALAAILRESGTVEKITIIPRAAALGVTFISHEDAARLQTQGALNHRLDVLLAGRCAEELVLGNVSSGASSDLQHATGLATDMITKYGLGDGLAVLDPEQVKNGVALDKVNALLGERYQATLALLAANRAALEQISDLLLEHETIEGELARSVALESSAANDESMKAAA